MNTFGARFSILSVDRHLLYKRYDFLGAFSAPIFVQESSEEIETIFTGDIELLPVFVPKVFGVMDGTDARLLPQSGVPMLGVLRQPRSIQRSLHRSRTPSGHNEQGFVFRRHTNVGWPRS